jgi:lipopolysaccharide export system permease protein
MFILNRYILRQFGQIFSICFVSLIGLYIVIDAFGHLDHFSSYADQHGNLFQVLIEHYSYHSLPFFDKTSGILAMISAIFTVAWLGRNQELTAFMAAGISKFRVLKPVLAATIVISFVAAANREWVLPRVRDQINRDIKDLGKSADRKLEPRFDAESQILIGGDRVMLDKQWIGNPSFVLPPELARYGRQLAATVAVYKSATDDQPAGFLLTGLKTPPASQICRMPSLSLGDRPVILTPRDTPWLLGEQIFVVSQVPFPLLASGSNWRSYASMGELIGELSNPGSDPGPDVRVAVHARLMQPILDGVLVMLGVPLMLSRRSRNVFLSIGICLTLAAVFTLVALACRSLGNMSMVRPSLAAWLPLLMFVPVATAMSHSLRT